MNYLSYKNVHLVPQLSCLPSRSLADTSVEFLHRRFKLPVVPSNMKDVINEDIAIKLSELGYFYIMHRWFCDTDDTDGNCDAVLQFVEKMNRLGKLVSISVGMGEKWDTLIEKLFTHKHTVDFITVDVAHAHHEDIISIIKIIKHRIKNTQVIVGNVATAEGCEYLIRRGADAIKVGIGGGRICTTKNKTGFHVPMFSCCLQCAPVCDKYKIPFIADGGIEDFGDIAKALTAGATMVMAGGIFAECIDSPAEIVEGYKQYRGSTSFEMKGKNHHIEGKKVEIVHSVKYNERMNEIEQALRSAISYAGGNDLSAFKEVQYITV